MSEKLFYRGSGTLTQFQILARVNRDTGLKVRLRREESYCEDLTNVDTSDTMVRLVFAVKEFRVGRRGRVLVREGVRGFAAVRIQQRWSIVDDITVLSDVENGQVLSYLPLEGADEAMERIAYEEMCYRPGT